MEQEPTTEEAGTTAPPPPEDEPKRPKTTELTRASEEAIFGGVAKGIANRTGIWSVWIRAAFVILAFAGGLGVVLYLAGWFLIRADDEPDSLAERFFANTTTTGSWVGVALIFAAVLIILDNATFLSGGIVWAIGLLIVGLLLYSGDLPRLINEVSKQHETKEGVQRMKTTQAPGATDESTEQTGREGFFPPTPPPGVPTPPLLPPVAPPREKSILGRLTFGVMAIALAVLAFTDNLSGAVNPEPRHYLALAVTVLGVGLVVGAFVGRARWLILIGVLSVPMLLASPILEVDLVNWESDTTFLAPDNPEEIPTTISVGVGEIVIDLTEMEWSGEEVMLDAELDVGEMRILIPEDVGVSGIAHSSIGAVEFERQQNAGFNPAIDLDSSGDAGHLELIALVRIGNLEIERIPTNG